MKIDSQNIEFGYELISVIPFAYWLYENGQLESTMSGIDTEMLYYFSPKHEINPEKRDFANTHKVNYPNIHIHKPKLNKSQFSIPPYKKVFKNTIKFDFKKELVIICNRYNIEWNIKAINYFDLPTLRKMFDLLKDKYQVIYINVDGVKELYDQNEPIPLGDYDLLKEYPEVINFHDLLKKHKKESFNSLQLCLFANCSKFITMNGGHAILATYFGGENIIMSKPGYPQAQELDKKNNSFYRWYRDFSGQRCIHVPRETDLLDRIKDMWIDLNPVANVLIRTSNRPNFFKRCMESVLKQDYKNINIFVSLENSNDYTIEYPVYPVYVEKTKINTPINNNKDYGRECAHNLYMNELHKAVTTGLILYMDDDDHYTEKTAISKIMDEYKKGNELIFWRAQVGEYTLPYEENFGKAPVLFQCSTISFAFDAKYKEQATWEPYKRGDYRVASKLWNVIEKRGFINEVLASTQNGLHFGISNDYQKIINKETMKEEQIEIKIISNKLKGRTLGLKIGSLMTLPASTAFGLIKVGVAIQNINIPEIEPEIPIEIPIIEELEPETVEVEDEIKEEYKPKMQRKRGRKSKK